MKSKLVSRFFFLYYRYNDHTVPLFRLSASISLPPTPITDPEKFGIKSASINKEYKPYYYYDFI